MEGEGGTVIDCRGVFEHLRAAVRCTRQAVEEDFDTASVLIGMAQVYRKRAATLIPGCSEAVERMTLAAFR